MTVEPNLHTAPAPLDRSETLSLIGSDKVAGTAVYASDGEKMGRIERVMIGKYNGKAEYAVMSFGGFMGFGEDYYPLPWKLLTYNPQLGGYQLNIGEDQLNRAPKYNEQVPWDWTDDRARSVDDYWVPSAVMQLTVRCYEPRKGQAMAALESVKKMAEEETGWASPSKDDIARLVQLGKADTYRFADDGTIPNHPKWPLIVYRNAVRLPDEFDPAAVFEVLFDLNEWGGSWRDGIYEYAHYHARIHEVLGIARGHAKVQFGGARGGILELNRGDVAILPAGTGHQRLAASEDLLVVGAYPQSGDYDECTSREAHAEALKAIPKVPRPCKDPVYGSEGPLLALWASL